ncbi:MAG: ABC transporter permease [Phycisphaerales bacterium]
MSSSGGGTRANESGGHPVWRRLLLAQESGLILVIVLMMIALSIFSHPIPSRHLDPETGQWVTMTVNAFFNTQNLVLVATQASYTAIMAVGMTAIIVLGGIDLSVGSIYAVSAIVGAIALRALEQGAGDAGAGAAVSIAVGLGVCVLTGMACGVANGAMVVGLRVHPFIITLGTMAALRGVAFIMTKGQSVSGLPTSFVAGFMKLPLTIGGKGSLAVYPVPVVIMGLVAMAGHFVLTRTVPGRQTFAIGGNETAAKYAGIGVGYVKVLVFAVMGALAGLSAAVYIGYYGAATSAAGTGDELTVIAASVIGGASLSGGRGSALGAVLGAVLIQLITNAMIILSIDTNYTQVVMGAAIVIAVVLDQLKTRLMPTGR